MNFYKNKSILVTGGVGTIGSEIVRTLLKFDPKVVRVLDINETGLFELEHELNTEKIRVLIGNVENKDRLERALQDIDIVFHAAALKHVPLCEYNPFEAIRTNVIGTQNLIEMSLDKNVKKFITISTDKAVSPINVMGATKLLGERLTLCSHFLRGKKNTTFSCVRFGNVIGSRGSVVPLFYNQIKNNQEVTVTNKNMTRFCMSVSKAVDLVLKSTAISEGGEIFVLKMPIVTIGDLASCMIKVFGKNTKIKIIGDRINEKMHEELVTLDEIPNTYENEYMYVILPQYKKLFEKDRLYTNPSYLYNFKKVKHIENKLLNKSEIVKMLKAWGDGK